MKNINFLVLCTGNSCRSQITEGFLRHYCKKNNWNAKIYSAGIKAEGVNPKAIKTMKEIGIDISHHQSNCIEEFDHLSLSHLLTVCDHADESCPTYLKNANHYHKNFRDPSKENGNEDDITKSFRNCRNEIEQFVIKYLKTIFVQ